MPIILDHQLREYIPHNAIEFPITYFHDELVTLPEWSGPLHWHPDFEIATAVSGVLDYQVGQEHIILEAGDSIFVNGNMLHGIKQLSGNVPDPMPNIVFSGALIASETSAIYQKYLQPIAQCDSLPFIVFRSENVFHYDVNRLIKDTYRLLDEQPQRYEMAVQRNISLIFEYILRNFDKFPRSEATRTQIQNQIRFQKMLAYIHGHYTEAVTLEDIAKAADISRSEAGRCFNTYMGCSPVDALIQYRLQAAHRLLSERTQTLQQISYACGFNSVNYFSRLFKKKYGYAPSKRENLGK
ncbi:MAG: AraC family transcriptional regulator [Ruminococcaceae bacterium]|nr:AraC family transcriptional regulator [Oscillospiraceae bacterium]